MKSGRPRCKATGVAFVMVLLVSCYQYRQVRIANPIHIGKPAAVAGKISAPSLTPEPASKKFVFSKKKQFCRILSWSPRAEINNSAVELALEGKLPEAEILFRDVIEDDPNEAAAHNNLGIIYEIAGDMKAAFDMYSRACILDPGNVVFRQNFMTCIEAQHDIVIGDGPPESLGGGLVK